MSCLQNPQTLINLRCKSIQAMNWMDSQHSPTSDYSVSLSLYDISHVPYREYRCVWNSVRTTTGWLPGLRWRQRSRLQLRVRSAQRWSACTAWTLWTIRAPSNSSWTPASAPPTFWPQRAVRSTTHRSVIKHSTRCSCLNLSYSPENLNMWKLLLYAILICLLQTSLIQLSAAAFQSSWSKRRALMWQIRSIAHRRTRRIRSDKSIQPIRSDRAYMSKPIPLLLAP